MKNIFSISFLAFFCTAFCIFNLNAQTTPRQISGGVLNSKAVKFPKPEYPAAAKAVKADGQVQVQILIDEVGKVMEAKAISGHLLLRQSTEEAALKTTFQPTYLNGKTVKVSGILLYHFYNDLNSDYKIITGGVLNGKALNLPKPEYPAAAKAVNADGQVQVQIIIDEDGNVINILGVSGHALLKQASIDAALQPKFSPTYLGGKAVKVSGVIIYFFSDNREKSEDFLTEQAIYLPQPSFPSSVEKTVTGKTVKVEVTIDKEGKVVYAKAFIGNKLFYEAAENAAKEAKFHPTELNGEKVEITGVLTYKFIPEN